LNFFDHPKKHGREGHEMAIRTRGKVGGKKSGKKREKRQ
jgi:hypothetical protein